LVHWRAKPRKQKNKNNKLMNDHMGCRALSKTGDASTIIIKNTSNLSRRVVKKPDTQLHLMPHFSKTISKSITFSVNVVNNTAPVTINNLFTALNKTKIRMICEVISAKELARH
jgi:hypothetical protein